MSGSNISYTVGNATTNFLCLKCFTQGVILQWLRIWFVFSFNLSSWLFALWWFDRFLIYTSVLSSTAFTYSYVFKIGSFELSECDRTLISLCFLSQTLSVQIICILLKLSNVFSASLSAEDTETNIKSIFNANSFTWNPEKWGRPPDNPSVRGNVEQPPICCMMATCPSDVNHQGHLCNNTVPSLSL